MPSAHAFPPERSAAHPKSAPWRSSKSSSRRAAASTEAASSTPISPAISPPASPSARCSCRTSRDTSRPEEASSPTPSPRANSRRASTNPEPWFAPSSERGGPSRSGNVLRDCCRESCHRRSLLLCPPSHPQHDPCRGQTRKSQRQQPALIVPRQVLRDSHPVRPDKSAEHADHVHGSDPRRHRFAFQKNRRNRNHRTEQSH